MFYEMFTRELPRGNFQPPSQTVSVDVRIDEVVLRAMESERERRYSSAGEMWTELEAATIPTPPFPTENFKTKSNQQTHTNQSCQRQQRLTPPANDSKRNNARIYGKIGLAFLTMAFLIPVAVALLLAF